MYKIGKFIFEINVDGVPISNHIKKFKVTNGTPNYTYDIKVVDYLEVTDTSFVAQKKNIKVVMNGRYEKRYLLLDYDVTPYAVYEEIDDQHACVRVNRRYLEHFDPEVEPMFISLLALERHLYVYDSYILHSAYMIKDDKAILFTAPSGVGKSTQADLWVKYRGARVINGDRSLLQNQDDRVSVCGFPVCGSSGICFNEDYPIAAIVILSQGKENVVRKPSKNEVIKKLFREITINYHNMPFFDDAMTFIEELYDKVPIYSLQCDISEDAVNCLEKQLLEDDVWNL